MRASRFRSRSAGMEIFRVQIPMQIMASNSVPSRIRHSMAATCILSCRGDVTFMMQDTVKSLSGMRARSTEYSQLPLPGKPGPP